MLKWIVFFAGVTGLAARDSLTVRNAHAMAYDRDRGVVVLFGGADENGVSGDTWEWNGSSWKRVSTTGPSPRTFPAMTYDSVHHVTLLFGGNRVLFGANSSDAKFLNDFWQWDGKRWRQIAVPGPSPRAEAAAAFDSDRGRAVLFGGYRREGEETLRLGDTWEWDGRVWKLVSESGPMPRNNAAMVYDAARHRMVLFGGPPMLGAGFETWEWDGSIWSQAQNVAEGRFNPAMAFDSARYVTVRFGGWNSKERTADTWEYDGRAWTRRNVTGPPARNHSAMVYDSRRKRAVLFGGHDGDRVFGDLWEWDGIRWTERIGTPPRQRVDNGH